MRKFTFLRPFHCDILVFDTIGTSWIHNCFPDGCSVRYLDMRHRIPLLLSTRFLGRLIQGFCRQKRDALLGNFSYICLSALFDQINPKMIFSCADNNVLVSNYSLERPDVPVVFLQNALRDTVGSITPGICLPTYLPLGNVEAEIFKEVGVRCAAYRPVGSVKLGLALAQYKESTSRPFDLCFISHYRPELFASNASELFKKIEQHQRSLFKNLVDYALTYYLSLVVVSKTREPSLQTAEKAYFSAIAQRANFEFIGADKGVHEFNTYLAGLASDLIIHPASTLGFELFSAGKKVLFGACANPDLIHEWGIEHYFHALPGLVKLKSDSSEEFGHACDRLRQMPISQYLDITQQPAQTIVSMPEGEYPHDVIRRLISDHLS